MNRQEVIAYAASFVSFLLEQKISQTIRKILLFGSVARGTFDEESDVDIFIDAPADIEKEVRRTLALFQHSEVQKKWELKGVKNDLSIKVGDLQQWKLKRDILNDSLLLYGKYSEQPENLEHSILLQPETGVLKRAEQVSVWRKLYGYKQKVGKNTYTSKGLVEKIGGRRISSGILVCMENKREILEYLKKKKVRCTIEEVWTEKE